MTYTRGTMRRLVTTAVAIALVGGAFGAPAVAADNDRPGAPGSFPGSAGVSDSSATLVLRDLWMKRSQLRGAERRQADALLARPTDGVSDDQGFGYTVPE